MRDVVVAVVDRERGVREHRVEPVDRAAVQGLPLAGRHGHRVDRDTAVHPGRVVALEQRVRQRGQDEVVQRQRLPPQAAGPQGGQVGAGDPADEQLRQRPGVGVLAVAAQRPGQCRSDELRRAQAVEHEGPGFLGPEDLGQQLVEVVHRDALLAQDPRERVVLLAGPLGPQHVVEEQVPAVPGSEPAQLEPGPVHDHLPEPADLRVNAERVCHRVPLVLGRAGAAGLVRPATPTGPGRRPRSGSPRQGRRGRAGSPARAA